MKNLIKQLFIISLFILSNPIYADNFDPNANYTVCFTPGQDCTKLVVTNINSAKNSVLVQAYQLTSVPIVKALVEAKDRGVQVNVILDKSQYNEKKYSSALLLNHYNIPVWIDRKPAIAHNKVIIIDNQKVITGSFNFSKAAQYKNAENLILLDEPQIAHLYKSNWENRKSVSETFESYQEHKKVKF